MLDANFASASASISTKILDRVTEYADAMDVSSMSAAVKASI